MPHDVVLVERRDGVRRVILNRPEVLNAYDTALCQQLGAALLDFQRCDEDRVLVLSGAGRAFCVGGDVRSEAEAVEGEERQLGHGMVMREGMHSVHRLLHALDKPVIALIHGHAVAGGLSLALLCDFRIAAQSARLGDTSGRVGLLPDEGGAWLFPRAMGHDAALRMTLLGEVYDAAEAHRLGLVTEVVPDDRLQERGAELAAQIAAKAPLAVRMAKRMMRRSREQTFEESLVEAEYAVEIVNRSDDVREGVEAFVAKRTPTFTGH
ncbi:MULTISPECIES: enoyl-CoA hydratase-related protein [unclassified Nocardioides]|uniref:enoyl-CoA hydratase/isomerase family protein n=1 Tax=unclassified Nocardioides TaxID=2615069 RepID=UPI000056FF9B|nr:MULTISPECIES: enoyl-CoA hydratase-related protein [unclassified Nocardioides]ABL83607.1 short chain enoyl-CoA hydratase [Nocardioides sp. JS614]